MLSDKLFDIKINVSVLQKHTNTLLLSLSNLFSRKQNRVDYQNTLNIEHNNNVNGFHFCLVHFLMFLIHLSY